MTFLIVLTDLFLYKMMIINANDYTSIAELEKAQYPDMFTKIINKHNVFFNNS